MKSFYLSGILFLTFVGGILFSSPTFATSDQTTVSQTSRPPRLSLEQAILKVRAIGKYEQYFPANNSPALGAEVKFYQEYNYLRSLVTTARALLADYDNADTDALNDIIAAANDAEIACNLKFGITRQQLAAAEAKTPTAPSGKTATPSSTTAKAFPAQTSAQATNPVSTPASASKATTKASAVEPVAVSASQAATPAVAQSTQSSAGLNITVRVVKPENADLAESTPASEDFAEISDDQSAKMAQLLAHGSTATIATGLVGTIVYNERRTYRPGRSKR